jgi:hypothetical protein
MLVEAYERWLYEVWSKGDEVAAGELVHENLIDHNPLPGQPPGGKVIFGPPVRYARRFLTFGSSSMWRSSRTTW